MADWRETILNRFEKNISRRTLVSDQDGLLTEERMLTEIKGAPLLASYRGAPPRDVEALVGRILGLSELVEAHPASASIDINPLVVYEEGTLVVDAKVLIEGAEASA